MPNLQARLLPLSKRCPHSITQRFNKVVQRCSLYRRHDYFDIHAGRDLSAVVFRNILVGHVDKCQIIRLLGCFIYQSILRNRQDLAVDHWQRSIMECRKSHLGGIANMNALNVQGRYVSLNDEFCLDQVQSLAAVRPLGRQRRP